MKKSSIVIWIILIIIVILGIIFFTTQKSTYMPSSLPAASGAVSVSAPTTPTATVVLNATANPSLGTILVATNGMTLYYFTQDTAGVSTCTGSCAVNWPPYIVSVAGPLVGGSGVNGSVQTITRADGTSQVTYNGKPLYFWSHDGRPGDATGNSTNGFFAAKP